MDCDEIWTMSAKCEKKKISTFKIWCYRRLLKISWRDYVTKQIVSARIGEERKVLLEDIKNGETKYLERKIRTKEWYFCISCQKKNTWKNNKKKSEPVLLITNSQANSRCKTLRDTIKCAN